MAMAGRLPSRPTTVWEKGGHPRTRHGQTSPIPIHGLPTGGIRRQIPGVKRRHFHPVRWRMLGCGPSGERRNHLKSVEYHSLGMYEH